MSLLRPPKNTDETKWREILSNAFGLLKEGEVDPMDEFMSTAKLYPYDRYHVGCCLVTVDKSQEHHVKKIAEHVSRPSKQSEGGKKSRRSKHDAPPEYCFTDARRVSLLASSARSSYDGLNLNFFDYKNPSSVETWLERNNLMLDNRDENVNYLLELVLKLSEALYYLPEEQKKFTRKVKLPIVHNQLTGKRFILKLDSQPCASPAWLQFLLHEPGQSPFVKLFISDDKPERAKEHRPDLLIASDENQHTRLYLRDTPLAKQDYDNLKYLPSGLVTPCKSAYEMHQHIIERGR